MHLLCIHNDPRVWQAVQTHRPHIRNVAQWRIEMGWDGRVAKKEPADSSVRFLRQHVHSSVGQQKLDMSQSKL